jgi:5'-nucleotidase
MTRILITNDDGIDSPGLWCLAGTARDEELDVVVAAPHEEASGSSASITIQDREGRIRIEERELAALPGVPAYAVVAPPALITLLATRGAFGDPPSLVLSGINRGANTGHAVLHSGTVGAALTAAANGRPAMAVSLDVGLNPAGAPHWESAARFVRELLPVLCRISSPTVLNLNAPDRPEAEIGGLRHATLAAFGVVQTKVEKGDGHVRMALADEKAEREPGTDAAWLSDGYATLTAINPVFEASDLDLDELTGAVSRTG